jgi:DNA-binding IclR family transcriptional regulator
LNFFPFSATYHFLISLNGKAMAEEIVDRDAMKGTIVRCIRMIERLAEAESPISASDLAEQLGLAVSTTHRILGQLRQEGIASRDPNSAAYRAGPELVRVAALIMGRTSFQREYLLSLKTIMTGSGETSFLATWLPAARKMQLTHVVQSAQPIQYVMAQGSSLSVLFGASGRVIAAHLPRDVLQEMHAAEASIEDNATMLPPFADLLRELDAIREAGFAISSGQRVQGAHAVVAPVFAEGHRIMGSIGISMPVFRADPEKDAHSLKLIVPEARRLCVVLGDT